MNDLRKHINIIEANLTGHKEMYLLFADETAVGYDDSDINDVHHAIGIYSSLALAEKAKRKAIKNAIKEYVTSTDSIAGNYLTSGDMDVEELLKHYQQDVFTITTIRVDDMNPVV